jgi:asparagine synthase (glutamine-hydrolysing)
MSAIFGLFQRDGAPLSPERIETLRQQHQTWGPDGGGLWRDESGSMALGQARFITTPESAYEHLPIYDQARNIAFTAAGRIDRRAELLAELAAPPIEAPTLPDGDLIYRAYLRWGEAAPQKLYGDWAFAAYHLDPRRLFAARDHLGSTAFYYYADPHLFAFASNRFALQAIGLPLGEMDELYLAQILISWPAHHGERTIFTGLKRLPPAHSLTISSQTLATRCYWRLEQTPLLRLPKREDYIEGFLEVFDQAVAAHLRAPQPGKIASLLSGGLDSGAVTATAAHLLNGQAQTLDAYTSVPLGDTTPYVGKRFGDEWPLAHAVTELAGNIRHIPIPAPEIGILESLQTGLTIHGEPSHSAGNLFWIFSILQAIQASGCRVALIGQMGNASISWRGSLSSQPIAYQLRQMGLWAWAKERFKRQAPPGLVQWIRKQRTPSYETLCRASAIHPQWAKRLKLFEQMQIEADQRPPRTAMDERLFIHPGRSNVGAVHAQLGVAFGVELRDPTSHRSVLEFTFAVPDWVFTDPVNNLDRWLVRSAMQGRLPDEVRLNRTRGRQSGDLPLRLRAEAAQVEATLDALEHSPAVEYLHMPHLRQVWRTIQSEDSNQAFIQSLTILTRGLMAGLFIKRYL